MRRASIPVLILVAVTLVPSLDSAQGTLTGTVRDESGGVLGLVMAFIAYGRMALRPIPDRAER